MKRFATALVVVLALPILATAQAELFVHNFHRVNDHVWRGAEPGTEGVRALAAEKAHTILDLRSGEEKSGEEKKAAEAVGLNYINVPMSGYKAPTAEQVEKVLGILNDSTQWPIFVHCHYGKDRTGTVIACYRIQHDHWDNRKALDEAKSLGMHSFERNMRSYIGRFEAEPEKTAVAH